MSKEKDIKFECMRICDVLNQNQIRKIKKLSKDFNMQYIWILQILVNLGFRRVGD